MATRENRDQETVVQVFFGVEKAKSGKESDSREKKNRAEEKDEKLQMAR